MIAIMITAKVKKISVHRTTRFTARTRKGNFVAIMVTVMICVMTSRETQVFCWS